MLFFFNTLFLFTLGIGIGVCIMLIVECQQMINRLEENIKCLE